MRAAAETENVEGLVAELLAAIERHWGFKTLRPLQDRAMRSMLAGRDSLLVLPTGGGKSLCYQAPALVCQGTTVVVSPLISLMKDQVDSLRTVGV
jgi:ATP-dependent DNA helicase RecQ